MITWIITWLLHDSYMRTTWLLGAGSNSKQLQVCLARRHIPDIPLLLLSPTITRPHLLQSRDLVMWGLTDHWVTFEETFSSSFLATQSPVASFPSPSHKAVGGRGLGMSLICKLLPQNTWWEGLGNDANFELREMLNSRDYQIVLQCSFVGD